MMIIGTAYIILALVTTLYSIILERVHDRYIPDYTWLTVVIGNGMLIAAIGIVALLEPTLSALDMFGVVIGVNIVGGAPVIIWQFWQAWRRWQRRQQRRQRGT